MGKSFEVDLSTLQQFVTALRNSTAIMEGALDSLRDIGFLSIGSYALDRAADDFQHTWRYGLGKLKDKTTDAADKTDACHEAYSTVEASLVTAFETFATGVAG